jgi:thiamine-monophosphate kinase
MSLSRLGEFRLIDRLAGVLGQPTPPELLIGIGDDAAVWRPTPGAVTVATADALVQGVHFDLATTSWADLGWKALAENVSDVAAMGCAPRYALVALALPGDIDPTDVEALYRGMAECADAYRCAVVGGDVVSAPTLIISVTLIGESMPGEGETIDLPPVLTRSAARPGDVLAVTGPLGASAAGLRLLESTPLPNAPPQGGTSPSPLTGEGEGGGEPSDASVLIRAHLRPTPRVTTGQALVQAGIRCAIDVSDGLVADVEHLCERSGVAATIDAARVPVHPAVQAQFPDDALNLALTGGEDYELVCAGSRENVERARELLQAMNESDLTTIGEVLSLDGAGAAVRVRGAAGETLPLARHGYQHFSSNGGRSHDG